MVKAQSSVEFMLILAALAVLAAIALAGASSQLRMASEFRANASSTLNLSTAAFLSNLSGGSSQPAMPPDNNSDDGYPELGLELYVPLLHVGEPSIIQATVWNYGGTSEEVAGLGLASSNPAGLALSPDEEGRFSVGISHTLSAVASSNSAGTYTISATAFGEDGEPLRSSNGTLLRVNKTAIVLPSYGTGLPQGPSLSYTIGFNRTGEKIAYALAPMPELIREVRAVRKPAESSMDGDPYCRCVGARAWWVYVEYVQNAEWMCGCLYYIDSANASMISTLPQVRFSNNASATNATNATTSCVLSHNASQCSVPEAMFALAANVSATGPSPASDSIAAAPSGGAWQLRSLQAYNAYVGSFNSLDALASTVNGQMHCGPNCQGIEDLASATDVLRISLMNSTPSSSQSCAVESGEVLCAPASFGYPTVLIRLNSSFTGGHISDGNPDRLVVSGIDVEVRTD